MKTKLIVVSLLAGLVHLPAPSYADGCPAPADAWNSAEAGDDWYWPMWNCDGNTMLALWNEHEMEKAYWDEGFGFDTPCDLNRALARTLNALWVLRNSAPETLDASHVLKFGAGWVKDNAPTMRGGCFDSAVATCYNCRGVVGGKYIKYFQTFYFKRSVVERASTIIHETRHINKTHDAGSACVDGDSCDTSWESNGANKYQAQWLREFVFYGVRANLMMKHRARDRANAILAGRFSIAPNPGLFIQASDVGPIYQRWQEDFGGASGWLGYPTTAETVCADGVGKYCDFQGGSIYHKPGVGAFEVHGYILEKYRNMGSERSLLGYPKSDEIPTSTGAVSRMNRFENGIIYWHPSAGAHEAHSGILIKWYTLGFDKSVLGYLKSDQVMAYYGSPAVYNAFENGIIYWHPSLAAYEVHGPIYTKWIALGFDGSRLGAPTSDERKCADGTGRYNTFQRCRVYYHPSYGAHHVCDNILAKWVAAGAERSTYGYPVGDWTATSQSFQRGVIYE